MRKQLLHSLLVAGTAAGSVVFLITQTAPRIRFSRDRPLPRSKGGGDSYAQAASAHPARCRFGTVRHRRDRRPLPPVVKQRAGSVETQPAPRIPSARHQKEIVVSTPTVNRTVLRAAVIVLVADQLTKLAGTINLGGASYRCTIPTTASASSGARDRLDRACRRARWPRRRAMASRSPVRAESPLGCPGSSSAAQPRYSWIV